MTDIGEAAPADEEHGERRFAFTAARCVRRPEAPSVAWSQHWCSNYKLEHATIYQYGARDQIVALGEHFRLMLGEEATVGSIGDSGVMDAITACSLHHRVVCGAGCRGRVCEVGRLDGGQLTDGRARVAHEEPADTLARRQCILRFASTQSSIV